MPPSDDPQRDADPQPAKPPGSTNARPSFLRTLAHELRNQIATINNTLFMLRFQARGNSELPPLVDMIARQAAGMTQILDLMVEAERLERGDLELQAKPVDIASIVDAAVSATAELRAAQGHKIVVSQPGEPVEIRGDASRLTRALTNVLDNASRHATGAGTIALEVDATREEVVFRIRDDGAGIAPERLPTLFNFFAARGDGSAGLGLGLPLAHGWVELHGGSLEASRRGNEAGTEMVIRLPRAPAAKPAPPPRLSAGSSTAEPSTTATRRRVLIVDDNAPLRASLSSVLEEMGHWPKAAADGREAIAMAESWQPEFVLLDIHMPGMSGFEVARVLRATYPPTRMQLVMMSGDTLDELMVAGARQAGFDHCIDKAMALESLHTILNGGAGAGR